MSDYRVEIKVRNGRILRRMNALGIFTVAELCRRAGLMTQQAAVGNIINLKSLPYGKLGEWRSVVLKIADVLTCLPEDLFSHEQATMRLQSNFAYMEMTSAELSHVLEHRESTMLPPDKKIEHEEINGALEKMIETLSQRDQIVLRGRFGLDGEVKTLDELSETFNVSRERIRQIEAGAISKMRLPQRARALAIAGEIRAD
ncbi:MAG: sigma-70 family RNA polymerase sigma factor, partial [Deltaproteobacteria bacterium]|nr:sigma-70 family RNA polymerase sigma factor [Deltaproteobacteria bacterium]